MAGYIWCKIEEKRVPVRKCQFTCGITCSNDIPKPDEAEKVKFLNQKRIREYYTMKEIMNGSKRFFAFEGETIQEVSCDDYVNSPIFVSDGVYEIESRLSKPDDGPIVSFRGKSPNGATIPLIVLKDGGMSKIESWEDLEQNPGVLGNAREIIAVSPAKQVYILKRKAV